MLLLAQCPTSAMSNWHNFPAEGTASKTNERRGSITIYSQRYTATPKKKWKVINAAYTEATRQGINCALITWFQDVFSAFRVIAPLNAAAKYTRAGCQCTPLVTAATICEHETRHGHPIVKPTIGSHDRTTDRHVDVRVLLLFSSTLCAYWSILLRGFNKRCPKMYAMHFKGTLKRKTIFLLYQ